MKGEIAFDQSDFIGINAPVIIEPNDGSPVTLTVAENTTAVADVNATDVDGDTITYSLTGDDAALFDVDPSTGVVTFKAAPNYEVPLDTGGDNVYNVTVVASDGLLSDTQDFTINVNNLDEVAPTITSGDTAAAIDENSGTGQVVYTASADDSADISAGVTFSLGGADAGAFSIDSGTGAVTLTVDPNYEDQSSYSFTVLADDGVNTPTEQTVTLDITNLDEDAPGFDSGTTADAIDENSGAGQMVYDANATDPATDGGPSDPVTYSFGGGTDDGLFSIDSGTGEVTLTGNPDYEDKSSYSFDVTATDDAGNDTTQTVTLAINDLDEVAPTVSSIVNQNPASANTNADSLTFRVTFSEAVANVSSGDFTVSGTTATVTGVSTVNPSTYDVTISGGNLASLNGTITLGFAGGQNIADTAGNALTNTTPTGTNNNSYTLDNLAPTVTVTGTALGGIGTTSTITFAFSEVPAGFTNADVTLVRGTLSTVTQNLGLDPSGATYTATFTRSANGAANVTVNANSYTDAAGNLGAGDSSPNLPAGVAGEPINLALIDPSADTNDLITVTVAGVPSGWSLNAGTNNGDGTWTVQTYDPSSLTITTAADFTGAMVLPVTMNWTNADGTTGSSVVLDNVEAYAPGSPIFAVSSEDHLSGSSGNDLFVFAQPIANDTIHNFNASVDKIDLIGFNGVNGFADLAIANDASGNAVITLAAGSTITVLGIDAAALTAANFEFNVEPLTVNDGTMTIHDGAILPLGGTIENSGTIELASTGSETDLQVLVENVTLQGSGQVMLSDSDQNVIFGGSAAATLININNTISGAGQIGAGQMTLVNEGTILANGEHALVIDTGSNIITNSGTLEATGSGGLMIESGLDNSGHLWANGGNVTVHGDVTGSGDAMISGMATLEFGAASAEHTTFADGGDGTLILDHASSFTGTVSGFNNGDSLVLDDVAFGSGTGTVLSYSANEAGTGGTLIVGDGAITAQISLEGDYTTAGFEGAYDQDGSGTAVVYDTAHAGAHFDQLVLGGTGNDILTGGSGIDFLVGGEGNDILVGGLGNDVLSGGHGADKFTVNAAETGSGNADAIVDYNFVEGDKIDISSRLDIALGKTVTDYVEVTQSGSDITVRVDVNGEGSFAAGANEVYTLTGIGTDGADSLSLLIDVTDHQFTV